MKVLYYPAGITIIHTLFLFTTLTDWHSPVLRWKQKNSRKKERASQTHRALQKHNIHFYITTIRGKKVTDSRALRAQSSLCCVNDESELTEKCLLQSSLSPLSFVIILFFCRNNFLYTFSICLLQTAKTGKDKVKKIPM